MHQFTDIRSFSLFYEPKFKWSRVNQQLHATPPPPLVNGRWRVGSGQEIQKEHLTRWCLVACNREEVSVTLYNIMKCCSHLLKHRAGKMKKKNGCSSRLGEKDKTPVRKHRWSEFCIIWHFSKNLLNTNYDLKKKKKKTKSIKWLQRGCQQWRQRAPLLSVSHRWIGALHPHPHQTTARTPVVAGERAVTITLPLIWDEKTELSSNR